MPPKKLVIALFALILTAALLFVVPPRFSKADELEDITKQLAELNDALNKSVSATKPLQSELDRMKKQIADIKIQVSEIEVAAQVKQREITKGYADLAEKEKIIAGTVRNFYINSYHDTPFLIFLAADDASEMTQMLAYQRAKTRQDKTIITNRCGKSSRTGINNFILFR